MAKNLKITKKNVKDNLIDAKIDIAESGLLGSYDSQGNYFISPKIQEELVHIQKFKKTTFGNSLFCVAHHIAFGELVFEITYDKYVDEGFSVATLYVLENIVKINGYLQNTIKTKVCDYSDLIVDFIEKSYEFYNVEIDEDEAKDKKLSADVFINMYISSKKQYDKAINSILEKKLASLYEKYFNKRMAVLKSLDSEFASQVLDIYNKEHDLIDNIFLQNNKDFKALNGLLDKAIEQVSGLSKELEEGENEYNARIEKDKDDFEKSISRIYQQAESKAYVMLSKNERANMSDIMTDEQIHERNISDGIEEIPYIVNNGADVSNNETNELEKNTAQDELEASVKDSSDYAQTRYTDLESRVERGKKLDAMSREELDEDELVDEEDPTKMSKAQTMLYDMLSGKTKAKGSEKAEAIVDDIVEDRVNEEELATDVVDGGKAVVVSKRKARKIVRSSPEGVVEEKTLDEVVEKEETPKPAKPTKPTKTATSKTPDKDIEERVDDSKESEKGSHTADLRRLQDLRKKTAMPSKEVTDGSTLVVEKGGKKVVEPTKVSEDDVVIDKKKAATMSKAEQESYRKTVAKEETDKRESEAFRQIMERQRAEQAERQAKMDAMAKALEQEKRENEALERKNQELQRENEELEARDSEMDSEKEDDTPTTYYTSHSTGGSAYRGSPTSTTKTSAKTPSTNAIQNFREVQDIIMKGQGINIPPNMDFHKNKSLGSNIKGMKPSNPYNENEGRGGY